MKGLSKVIVLFLLAVCLTSTSWGQEVKPKYVFFFIGDGMSVPQVMVADAFFDKMGQGAECSIFATFPVQCPTITSSANSFITDSAAGGTALACGSKTNNHVIGMVPDAEAGLVPVVSIAEVARDAGRKVGILTSVTMNHATPASFYGHTNDRGNYYTLGLQMIASNFDYFGGGGLAKADDKDAPGYEGNLYDLAQKAGYNVTFEPQAIRELKPGSGKVFACRKDQPLPYAIDKGEQETELRLCEYVEKGIELLNNPNGFFMMVEGGKIDWACHANDVGTVIWEVREFDKAVRVAYDFAQKHPGEVLIVVSADHETGGLALGNSGTGYNSYFDVLQGQQCSKDAFSRQVNDFLKTVETAKLDDLRPILENCFGFEFEDKKNARYLNDQDRALLSAALAECRFGKNPKASSFVNATVLLFCNKAGLNWSTSAHTALHVCTYAYGVNAELFQGRIQNTDVAKILKSQVGAH